MSQDKLQIEKIDIQGRSIAVHSEKGNNPGLFWLSGFKSSMQGQKAQAIAKWAKARGQACTLMDYSGHGLSSGAFEDGTISDWLEEATYVFDNKTSGPQIIVGSSMGGWLALLLAARMKGRVGGLVLIAPAWDMSEKLMWERFPAELQKTVMEEGFYNRPSSYGDGDYKITRQLIEDGRKHLIGDTPLHLGCPVHILHGRQDADVPWEHGHALINLLPHDDVNFTLVPDGDHRLSRDEDIVLLEQAIKKLSATAKAT
ncbi:MAG: alpha/beta hydrolase [Hyphomicrobiales bacterium]